ncbi:MAG: hypothetical protein P1U63_13230 [Coxiellaceae bacterium]|nr:hypothetical protein [Coxiellaceae bacterium]
MSAPSIPDHLVFKVIDLIITVGESKYAAMFGLLLMGGAIALGVEYTLSALVSQRRSGGTNENRLFRENNNQNAIAIQRELEHPELGGMGSVCCIQ